MEFKKLLAIDAFFEGGRMIVGAMSVTYLMNSGLTVGQVGLLKTIQALTIIIGEYPTGILADTLGRKNSMIIALMSAIFSFIIYALGTHIIHFMIAELLGALSICFWSGAFESFAIVQARLESQTGLMDRFFHLNQGFNSAAVLIFGILGGYLINLKPNLPYFFGVIILGFSLLLLMHTQNNEIIPVHEKSIPLFLHLKTHIQTSFTKGILNPLLLPLFLISIALQFSIQPLLHLWQPFFLSTEGATKESINSIVFGTYCSVNVVTGFLSAQLAKRNWFRTQNTIIIMLAIFLTLYISISIFHNWLIVLILFSLLQGILTTTRTLLGIKLNERIPSNLRATILSSISLFSRFGMLLALQWIQILSISRNMENNINIIFSKFAMLSVFIFLAGLVYIYSKKIFYFNQHKAIGDTQ